jgi:hypothetical protein
MRGFAQWIAEARVRGSAAGDAMKKTLDFKVDAEWIKWSVEPKGWITDKGVKDSFDFSAAFYNPKVPKPAFFYLRAHAILEKPDAEYDSMEGGGDMRIKASLFLFNGRTGLGGIPGRAAPRSMRELLDREGHVMLSQRDDSISFPSALAELDGPSLRTPVQLADWVNKVIDHTDIGGEDDGEDDDQPDRPYVGDPSGRRLIGV